MEKIARLDQARRRELFISTAARMPYLSEAAIEKDFWVCWTLKQLFSSELKNVLIFKGGTSLSKIFHLIGRFSEDIDLILNWRSNPVGDPSATRSHSRQERFNCELEDWSNRYISETILPQVKALCNGICSAQMSENTPENIMITYPASFPNHYLRPQIQLEIGAKAAWVPHAGYRITPYAADAYPTLFREPDTEIIATTPERSFWEKVTILHAEANRPADNIIRERYSRHYYDTVMMARSPFKLSAFANLELLRQVVEFKDKFYHCGWARYADAVPGRMKLLPPEHSQKALREDYAKMRVMIYGDYLPFDTLLDELRQLEQEINTLDRSSSAR